MQVPCSPKVPVVIAQESFQVLSLREGCLLNSHNIQTCFVDILNNPALAGIPMHISFILVGKISDVSRADLDGQRRLWKGYIFPSVAIDIFPFNFFAELWNFYGSTAS